MLPTMTADWLFDIAVASSVLPKLKLKHATRPSSDWEQVLFMALSMSSCGKSDRL
jgi:hypothetical protein